MAAAESSTIARSNSNGAKFATTHWSLILTAAREDRPESAEALEALCRTYWKPLYAFVRRNGYSPADAEDFTQGFFAHLIHNGLVRKVKVEGGRFRSFLLVSLKNFLLSERDRAHAQKRGGGCIIIPIDTCAVDPGHDDTPDVAFDKAWALTVLQQAMQLLVEEHDRAGRRAILEELRVYLMGDEAAPAYLSAAQHLGTSEGAVKMMVLRMRRQYRECLRSVIGRTVSNSAEVDEELQHLMQALGR